MSGCDQRGHKIECAHHNNYLLSLLHESFDLDAEIVTPAMLRSSDSDWDSLCRVCQNEFDDPRLLGCLHSFCRKCLLRLWHISSEGTSDGRRSIHCPLCESVCLISKDGIEGLLKDVTLPREEKKPECASCKEKGERGDSTAWCGKCQAAFCNNHAVPHMLTNEGHNIAALSDSGKFEYLCTEHNQPLDYYCGHCRAAMCGDCIGPGKHAHGHHKPEEIGAMIKRRIDEISVRLATLEHLGLPRAKKAAKSANQSVENLRNRAEQLRDDVRSARKKMMIEIDSSIAKKLEEIDDTEQASLRDLELYSNNGIKDFKNLSKCVKTVDHFMNCLKLNEHAKENIASLLGAVEERLDLLTQLVKKGTVVAPLLNLQRQSPIKISADVGSMIGKVVTCKASAFHSYVVKPACTDWRGEHVTSIGGTAAIVVQARDADNQPLSAGGDIIKTEWLQSPAKTLPTVDVIDYDNGRYLLTFTLQEEGKYLLAVIINGCQMTGMVFKECEGPPPVTFDTEATQEGIVIGDDCRCATLSGRSGLKVFMGQLETTKPLHQWMVKVSGTWDLSNGCQLGVAARSQCQEIVSNSSMAPWAHLALWNGHFPAKWANSGNGYGLQEGDSWKHNDVIHVLLNLNNRTLWLINLRSGRDVYFENLPKEELVPVFYLGCNELQESQMILLE